MLDRFPTFFLFFKNFDILLLSWWWSFWWDLVSKIKEFLPPLEPNLLTNKYSELGGSPGLVVMGDYSCSRSSGFESLRHTLGGHDIFSHWSVVKIVLFLKRPKTNKKMTGLAHLKNKYSEFKIASQRFNWWTTVISSKDGQLLEGHGFESHLKFKLYYRLNCEKNKIDLKRPGFSPHF